MSYVRTAVVAAILALSAAAATAQPLGTYQWQLYPYCNVITLAIAQSGAIYTLHGTDDQCGGPTAAAATGLAFVNPNGSLGFGITIVTSPGGTPVTVDASITLPGLSGTWRDSGARTGAFVFSPSAGSGGVPRPLPEPALENVVQVLRQQVAALELTAVHLATGNAVIPPGALLTGVLSFQRAAPAGLTTGSETILFPAEAPVALTDATVNLQPILYGSDGDHECTGTVAAPTAPPGKVCIYMNRWGSGMRFYNGQALPLPTKGFKVAWTSDGTAPVEEMSGSWAYRAP